MKTNNTKDQQFGPRQDSRQDRPARPEEKQPNQLAASLEETYAPLYPATGTSRGRSIPTLVADDRSEFDQDEDGRLKRPFGQVLVKPWGDTVADVCIRGSLPLTSEVCEWAGENGAGLVTVAGSALQMRVTPNSTGKLRDLAETFDDIAAPGRQGPFEGSDKVCKRTADSLRRLADNLDEAWRDLDRGRRTDGQGNGGSRGPNRTAQAARWDDPDPNAGPEDSWKKNR